MKLYYSPGACSMAPHILMHEVGMKFDRVEVDLKSHKAGATDFYQINAKGYVPTLELDNGQRLTENAAILQYVADQKPEANLIPKAGTFERYRFLEWLNFIATEVHKGFGPLWNPQSPDATKEYARTTLAKRFDYLESHLKNNQWMMGSQFTALDCYLFVMTNWCRFHKIDMAKWPSIMGFAERAASRPAVQMTLKHEGFLK